MTLFRFNLPKLLMTLLIALFISGCRDVVEVTKQAIVMALGIDQEDNSDKVLVTVQIVRPGEVRGGGGGTGGGSATGGGKSKPPAVWVVQNSGPDLSQAINNINALIDRRLFLQHNQIIVLGRTAAEKGVRQFLEYFAREVETREIPWILVTDRKASDILELKFGLESIPGVGINNLVENSKFVSIAGKINQQNFTNRLLSKTMAPYASLIRVSGEPPDQKVRLDGTAVFKRDKLAGILGSQETRGFLWVLGKPELGIFTSRFQNGYVDFQIVRSRSKITPSLEGNQVRIKIEVNVQSNLNDLSIPYDISKAENVKILERVENMTIRKDIQATIQKSQSLGTDIFGFGEAIHRKFPKEWQQMEPEWDKYFNKIEFQYQINAKVRTFGLISKPLQPK